MRVTLALCMGLLSLASVCRRWVDTGIAVQPAANADSARNAALDLAARLAARFALEATDPEEASVHQCFASRLLALCTMILDGEAQFYIVDGSRPLADNLKRELLDSLRASFGAPNVRECEWRTHRGERRWGCPPVVRPDSG